MVDEAHGAHFVVGEPFPRSALEMGADVVVHSAHKTLPAMTMASFLHVRSNFIATEKVARYLGMLQSAVRLICRWLADDAWVNAESYKEDDKKHFAEQRVAFIKQLKLIQGLQTVETDDPLKLIYVLKIILVLIYKRLEAEGIDSEIADPYQVLFVLPLLKVESAYPFDEICEKIKTAVACLDGWIRQQVRVEAPPLGEGISRLATRSRKRANMEVEWIPYVDSVGRVAAASIIPYPPGIPAFNRRRDCKG